MTESGFKPAPLDEFVAEINSGLKKTESKILVQENPNPDIQYRIVIPENTTNKNEIVGELELRGFQLNEADNRFPDSLILIQRKTATTDRPWHFAGNL